MTDGMDHRNGFPGQAPAPLQTTPWPPTGHLSPQAPPMAMSEPDWAAMADEHEAKARRRKLLINGGIAAGCVLAVAAGTLAVVQVTSKSKPSAAASAGPSPVATQSGWPSDAPSASSSASSAPSPSPSASAPTAGPSGHSATPGASPAATHAPVTGPTVPGQPNQLADHSGQANLALGGSGSLVAVSGGSAFKGIGNTNAYAESSGPLVDTGRSFTVSAWVESDTLDGSRSAISQGSGASFSFDLGRDDSGGVKSWAFRVQAAAGGADSTVVQVRGGGPGSAGGWVLLTGVYDASQKTITLYVGDTRVGTVAAPGVAAGSGPFELGRSRRQSAWAEPWAGVVGHVQVWDRPLGQTDVTAVLKSGGVGTPVHSWLV